MRFGPFFPCFRPGYGAGSPEHFADRKKCSAEMTAGFLAIIIDAHRRTGNPLYLLIADVKEAYDNVWRDALWAKALKAGAGAVEVRQARALYENMAAKIVEDGYESEIVEFAQGIPQGGPRSGKLFALYNSDLPDALRKVGAGTVVGEVEITCATFLDDSVVPTLSEPAARAALRALGDYGLRWSQQWSTPKFKMMCVNVTDPPLQWPSGNHWFDTVTATRYLGVYFDTVDGWGGHFAMKRAAAILARLELRRAGLFGGRNAPLDSLEVAKAMLWATVDYGRGVASSQGHGCGRAAKALDAFHIGTLREILGVSGCSVKAGVRGELGEIPDVWRERKRQLLVARQMLTSPEGSLMERLARHANASSPKLGIFRTVEKFLQGCSEPTHRLEEDFKSKRAIKDWIHMMASGEWRARIAGSMRLENTYPLARSLAAKGYLREAYPGRQILTKLRIDDLDLGAAGVRGLQEPWQTCSLCGMGPETRVHFVLQCEALETSRSAGHSREALDLTRGLDEKRAFEVMILARPEAAADDIERAKLVGKLLHALWTQRSSILGLRPSLD